MSDRLEDAVLRQSAERGAVQLSQPEQALLRDLRERGLLNAQTVDAALAERAITGETLGFILTRNGFIPRATLVEAILRVNPSGIVGEKHFSALIPPAILIRTRTMVVAETSSQIMLATLSTESQVRLEIAPFCRGLTITFVPFGHDQLEDYLSELHRLANDSQNLVERLLRRALREGCSDVHIVPRHATYTVLVRRLGVRHIAHEGDLEEYQTLAARIKDLARMDLAERRIPQDGAFALQHDGKIVDFRVATLPTASGELLVVRVLDPDRVQPRLDGLGITRLDDWRKGASRPDGLCLVCGPTGSGKTTTLNATLKELDRFGLAVYTAEDPVEYRIAYTGQVQINPAVGLDFARTVRAFLRADPDVIVLGEVRDGDTARNALRAAETGHLVLATLHTGSILGAVQRLRDLGVPPHELRHLIRAVLVQRLVRVRCAGCDSKGCPACFETGFSGRTLVSECNYFAGEREVSALLEGQCSWPSMLQDALQKADERVTTQAEVLRVFGAEAQAALATRG